MDEGSGWRLEVGGWSGNLDGAWRSCRQRHLRAQSCMSTTHNPNPVMRRMAEIGRRDIQFMFPLFNGVHVLQVCY